LSLRVALMRPLADSGRSAMLLRARGFAPVIAPVIEIRATGAEPPDDGFDAVLATSANAFAFLSPAARARLGGLTLHVAGARTAAAARTAGLAAGEACADAGALAAALVARLPRACRLLYLAGHDRKTELESALLAAGHRIVAVEVYVAAARQAWSAAEAADLATCGAALHYSRRSAELAVMLAERAGLADRLRATLHCCISMDAAEPLRALGAKQIVTAPGAQESLLIDALSSAANIS